MDGAGDLAGAVGIGVPVVVETGDGDTGVGDGGGDVGGGVTDAVGDGGDVGEGGDGGDGVLVGLDSGSS